MFYNVYNLETVSLRYFNVFGERQSIEGAYALVIGIFTKQLLDGKPMTIRGNGEQRRDFTYVGDVVNANILASKSKKVGSGEVINIGSGKNFSINNIADFFGGPKVYVDPVIEPFETLADNLLAKKLLNWSPTVDLSNWIKIYKKSILVK
jgi:UDP-glucose 4-epimerase